LFQCRLPIYTIRTGPTRYLTRNLARESLTNRYTDFTGKFCHFRLIHISKRCSEANWANVIRKRIQAIQEIGGTVKLLCMVTVYEAAIDFCYSEYLSSYGRSAEENQCPIGDVKVICFNSFRPQVRLVYQART